MGNICRSPLAAAILRHTVSGRHNGQLLYIDSAGTHNYNIGCGADGGAYTVARKHGLDLGNHRARQIEPRDFEQFDLILCVDTGTHNILKRRCPSNMSYKLQLLMSYAPHFGVMDIPDPYQGDEQLFDQVYALINQAVTGLCDNLLDRAGG